MSTGVSDQRMRGQGSQANGPNKDQLNDHEDFSSWRNQSIQNSYVSPAVAAATTSDHYLSSYYGPTFSYQLDHGTWSSNSAGGDTPFLAGYGAPSQQQQQQQQQHQDSYGIDGMFGPGGFSNFGAQPTAFGGGYGDYSTPWDRKAAHYDDYYHQQQHHHNQHPMYPQAATSRLEESSPSAAAAKQVEQGMQGLALETAKQQQQQESQQPKKLTWASIASQPAKPQLATKKKSMVPPPMVTPRTPSLDIGTWENKNGSNNPQQQQAPSNVVVQPPPVQQPPPQQQQQQQQRPARPTPPPAQPVTPPKTIAAVVAAPAPPAPLPPVQPPVVVAAAAAAAAVQPNAINNPVLEELQSKHIYNPKEFDLSAKNARFFVIKSYSEDDIHRSIKYEIWCSTEHGNKRLDAAFRERDGKGPVYLYFSVNGSGHFCGMAEMTSAVDMSSTLSVWSQDKWRGQFTVKWIYVKDVPNAALRHIRLENNENKPVTNSRDTQEVPVEKGRQVLKILHSYRHATSIFDDFSHYEKRQAEEDQRKTTVSSPGGGDNYENERNIPPPPPPQQRERDQRESYNNRPEQRRDGGFERDHHRPMDSRDFRGRNDRSGYDNYRDRDTRDSRDGGYQRDRDQHQRGPYRPSSDRETQGYRSNDRGDRGPVSGGGGRGRSGDASRPRH